MEKLIMEKSKMRLPIKLAVAHAMLVFSYSLSVQAAAVTPEVNIPRPTLPPPKVSPVAPEAEAESQKLDTSSDVRLTVNRFEFEGNQQISTETLSALVSEYTGREIGMDELNEAVKKVRSIYRREGYFISQVILPPQDIKKTADSTTVKIQIIEGALGELKVEAGEGVNESLMRDLSNNGIVSGDVVNEKTLVRNVILINALPGVRASSNISPGKEVGTSDVVISVEPEDKFVGYVTANTYGNPFVGRETVGFGVAVNNLSGRGDQLSLSGRQSIRGGLKAINLGYVGPIGSSANLLTLGYSLVEYELGGAFKSLKAEGDSEYFTAFLDRSLYRDSHKGINLRLGGIYKDLNDELRTASSFTRRDVTSFEAGISGEWVNVTGDVLYELGLVATSGRVDFKNRAAEILDATTLRTEGDFLKFNLNSSRTQIFENGINWALRADYQLANQNLDIAEKMGIGTANRWRQYAYLPSLANDGWMVGTDVKKDIVISNEKISAYLPSVAPYVFYDFGHGKINHDPLTSDNRVLSRHYGGGMNFNFIKKWNFDVSYSVQDRAVEGNRTESAYTVWGQLRKDF